MNIIEVENYFGFFEGIQGFELMVKFQEQVEWFGIEVVYDDVIEFDFVGFVKIVMFGFGMVYEMQMFIYVIGFVYCKLNIEGEECFFGYGVFWCVICDGFFFCEKMIVVVGGGDFVMEEVMFFICFVDKVYVIYCKDFL